MGSQHYYNNQKGKNIEDVDRLSSLPDDLIHKIFSSITTTLVVQTSVLSSRWRFIWTSIPCLNLSTENFKTLVKFRRFVTHVLSRRDNKIDVSSVKLRFHTDGNLGFGFMFVKEIMDYAYYHNIQQLNVSYLPNYNVNLYTVPPLQIPNCNYFPNTGKSIWELPALTTLYLQCAVFAFDYNDSLFSSCSNLKNLILDGCRTELSINFSICHPLLSNLTLDNSFEGDSINVVAPKLENLTITLARVRKHHIKISAPNLTSFVYKGKYCCLRLSTDGFSSLKQADICISQPTYIDDIGQILSLLQHLHNVKFLTLNKKLFERLSSYVEQIYLPQPSMFVNLKCIKICPQSVSSHGQAPAKSYFLDSSPGATFEEIVVQSLVVELQVLLEEEKANRTRMKQGKDPMKSHNSKTFEQVKPRGTRLQIAKRKSIISKLQRIEVLLAKLPASKRALIQPCFASLRAEVDNIVMDGITHCMTTTLKLSC